MKSYFYLLPLVLFVVFSVAIFMVNKYGTELPGIFGAEVAQYAYQSNEGKILRYLGKMEVYRGNAYWDADPAVRDYQNPDGSLIYEKVRAKFITWQIMSGETFDNTVVILRDAGYINPSLFKASQRGIDQYVAIQAEEDARLAAEAAAIEQKRLDDINNPTTTPQ